MRKNQFIIIAVFTVFAATLRCHAQNVEPYIVAPMPFNTGYFNEISPVIGAGGTVMFCSDRRLSWLTDQTSFDGRRPFNIFSVSPPYSSRSNAATEFYNQPGFFNSGPFCLSPDGKTIYFTSEVEIGHRTRNRSFVNRNGIFIAGLLGNTIFNIQPFPYNSLEYEVAHPSLSADGQTLWFASDKPGGMGGSDIYYSKLIDGQWSEPVNPGARVNSAATDNYPYIHASGRLYFSSDRECGAGHLDIYSTYMYGEEWMEPIPEPAPINSTADDFALIIEPGQLKGYFTSNRANSDDIYSFIPPIRRMAACDTLQENSYCYRFTEENAIKTDTIPFNYIWKFGDGTTATGAVVDHCYEKPGAYLVQLDVENLVTGEILYNEQSDSLFITDIEQPYITSLDMATAGAAIKLDAAQTYLPGWNIAEYYWNLGDETAQIGSEIDKTYTETGIYNIQLIVSEKAIPGTVARERCVCKNIIVRMSGETENY